MTKENEQPVCEHFDVSRLFEDRVHMRHAFTFKVQGNSFKGHYYEDQIQWLHPHPKQMIDETKMAIIEKTIHSFMNQYGIASEINDIQLEKAFEDRVYERQQFKLQVHGEEYKGFIHEGEIQWFHPQPKQKLDDQQCQVIESEIHEKIAKEVKDDPENTST